MIWTQGAHITSWQQSVRVMKFHPNVAPPVSVIARAGSPPWMLLAAHRILELGGIYPGLLSGPG